MKIDDEITRKRLLAKQVLAKKRRDQVSEPLLEKAMGIPTSLVSGFNKGLATGLGSFVDLFNIPFTLAGVGSKKPIGGSAHLTDVARDIGLTQDKPAYPFIERVGKGVGIAAPAATGMGAIARTSVQGGRVMAPILESFRKEPLMNAAIELQSAIGAGVGGAVAEEVMPESETAEMMSEMIGGFFIPSRWVGPAGKMAGKGARQISSLFSKEGVKKSAAKQIQKIAKDDPASLTARLKEGKDLIPGHDLTPAQQTGDEGLIRLERAMAKVSPEIESSIRKKGDITQRALRDEMEAIGGASREATQDILQKRIENIQQTADDLATRALLKAKGAIEGMPQDVSREHASRLVRDRIEQSYTHAKSIETQLWDAVDENVAVSTAELKNQYSNIVNSLRKAQQKDMPDEISALLHSKSQNAFSDVEELGEIKALRTNILNIIRAEKSLEAPNRNKIRVLNGLADTALKAMEKSPAAMEVKEARAYSRRLNEQFSQGVIGKIRRESRSGGLNVAPESTLGNLIREGPQGAVNIDALIDATKNDPEALAGVSDYLRRMFVKQAVSNEGKVVPNAAKRFINSYAESLDRLPLVKKELSNVKAAQEMSDQVASRMSARVKSITDKRRSRAALYLNAMPGKRIKEILNSRKPVANMAQIVRQVRKDNTGYALKGLKSEFMDEMWRSSITKKQGREAVSGVEISRFLAKNRNSMKVLFNKEELNRIGRIAYTARKLEGDFISGKPVQQILDETPDMLIDLLSRVIGANLGAASGLSQASGSSLVMAHAGSQKIRNLTGKIPMAKTRDVLGEAILNKGTMIDLLTKIKTPQTATRLKRRMNAWLLNIVPETREEQEKNNVK